MTIEFAATAALWLVSWAILLARWRSRRIEADQAAFLLAVTSAGSLAVYSLLRSELNAVILIVLLVWALVEFAIWKYVLRVFAGDRSQI